MTTDLKKKIPLEQNQSIVLEFGFTGKFTMKSIMTIKFVPTLIKV